MNVRTRSQSIIERDAHHSSFAPVAIDLFSPTTAATSTEFSAMNSLSYLSRQFDAVIASSSSSSSSPSSHSSSFSAPPSPRSSSASGRYPRGLTTRLKRVKSSPSIPAPQPQTQQQAPGMPTPPSSLNAGMNSSPTIRPKSPPDLFSRLVFVNLLLLLGSLVRAAWKSLSIRKQHVTSEPEVEVDILEVDSVVDLDENADETGARRKSDVSQRQQQHSLISSQQTSSSLSVNVQNHMRTFSPTPPPQRPTPFHLPKTLVLDLDETLIHSTSRPLHHHYNSSSNLLGLKAFGRKPLGTHTVEVVLGGRSTTYHVYKRPFVDYFLRKVS